MRHGSDGRRALLATGDPRAIAAFAAVVWLRRLVPLPWTESILPAGKVPLDPWPVAQPTSWLSRRDLVEPLATLRERGGLLVASVLTGEAQTPDDRAS